MTYHYTKLDDAEGIDGQPRYEIDDVHGFTVCIVDEEYQARLFCAAPDLLEALAQAVQALNTAPRFAVPHLSADSYQIAASGDRAIAKVQGS